MTSSGFFDALYRWRWWIIIPFALFAGLYGTLSDRRDDPLVWLVLLLAFVLLYLPIALRWIRSLRLSGNALRKGLNGD